VEQQKNSAKKELERTKRIHEQTKEYEQTKEMKNEPVRIEPRALLAAHVHHQRLVEDHGVDRHLKPHPSAIAAVEVLVEDERHAPVRQREAADVDEPHVERRAGLRKEELDHRAEDNGRDKLERVVDKLEDAGDDVRGAEGASHDVPEQERFSRCRLHPAASERAACCVRAAAAPLRQRAVRRRPARLDALERANVGVGGVEAVEVRNSQRAPVADQKKIA
jgi:hypothetical protein